MCAYNTLRYIGQGLLQEAELLSEKISAGLHITFRLFTPEPPTGGEADTVRGSFAAELCAVPYFNYCLIL
jgi:hypothetical protein